MKRISLILISLLFIFSLFISKTPLLSGISFSHAFYDQNHQLLRLTLSDDQKYRLFIPLKNIPKELRDATLLEEDIYFHWHVGINPIAIVRAVFETYVIHSRRIGASTITMQVARMRYHLHSKNLFGKLKQILYALQIEIHYSKDEILEAYLNLAPYGNNIEGVGAASLIYFAKPVSAISLPETLTLCVIPQNPQHRTPTQNILKDSRDKLFARWVEHHPKDQNKNDLIALPLQMQTLSHLPFYAPHFVNHLLKEKNLPSEINTTLDMHLQKSLEQVTTRYLQRQKNLGVNNAAVLLVDSRDMSVKALVGSADFFYSGLKGQINGTEIKRSPGSTLKPFIYALALDQGLIHPNTVLKDVPHSFGNYNPENFDYDFMGPIKAKDALTLSRNIPAIYLASQLSHPTLYEFLERANVRQLKSESYYGLALVLGGAEVTGQELAALYATLLNQGTWHPLRFQTQEPYTMGTTLLSPEASFLILDILKNTKRPPGYPSLNNQHWNISWKTGTSSGYRDAWTAGVMGPYVLVVWMGNFNNSGNHALVGKSMAAPLFFEIAEALHHEIIPFPLVTSNLKNLNLTRIEVCKASGMLPTRYCHDREFTWFIPGKSPIQTDTIFREIPIDKITGLRTCVINENTQFAIYEFWSSDLLKILKSAGLRPEIPPPFDSRCNFKSDVGLHPQITSPRLQMNYIVRANTENSIPLTAIAEADVSNLYWFLDETFLGKTGRDQPFIWLAKPGKYVVRVVDDHGRSDARDLIVEGGQV